MAVRISLWHTVMIIHLKCWSLYENNKNSTYTRMTLVDVRQHASMLLVGLDIVGGLKLCFQRQFSAGTHARVLNEEKRWVSTCATEIMTCMRFKTSAWWAARRALVNKLCLVSSSGGPC